MMCMCWVQGPKVGDRVASFTGVLQPLSLDPISSTRSFLLSASFLFLVLLKAILFLSFGYAAIWLAWLQCHL